MTEHPGCEVMTLLMLMNPTKAMQFPVINTARVMNAIDKWDGMPDLGRLDNWLGLVCLCWVLV